MSAYAVRQFIWSYFQALLGGYIEVEAVRALETQVSISGVLRTVFDFRDRLARTVNRLNIRRRARGAALTQAGLRGRVDIAVGHGWVRYALLILVDVEAVLAFCAADGVPLDAVMQRCRAGQVDVRRAGGV